MVIRKTTKKKCNARLVAVRARKQGYNATVSKRSNGRYAVSVTKK